MTNIVEYEETLKPDEYKSLYDYSDLEVHDLSNLYNEERLFITNFIKSLLKTIYSNEKWLVIGNGSNSYHCISTYSKVISFEISGRNQLCGSLVDYNFKLPRMYIQTLLIMHKSLFMYSQPIDIHKFFTTIKCELKQNTYLSPYAEMLMNKYKKIALESNKDKELILSLKNQLDDTQKIIKILSSKIEELKNGYNDPSKNKICLEDKH